MEEGLRFKPKPLQGLTLTDTNIETVFPVFYKYYDDHSLGRVVLQNNENRVLENVKVNLFVPQYMDNPKLCLALERLEPGRSAEIDLFGLFTNSVLSISETTKVSAQIIVEGTVSGKSFRNEFVETLRLHDRNAMTWDDDRKAAAFVTMKDPTVLRYSKHVAGTVKDKASRAMNSNLLIALAMHEALKLSGINYVIDPSTPYKTLSQSDAAVDYLQFPKQTLEYRAGDYDDLSILFSALL